MTSLQSRKVTPVIDETWPADFFLAVLIGSPGRPHQ